MPFNSVSIADKLATVERQEQINVEYVNELLEEGTYNGKIVDVKEYNQKYYAIVFNVDGTEIPLMLTTDDKHNSYEKKVLPILKLIYDVTEATQLSVPILEEIKDFEFELDIKVKKQASRKKGEAYVKAKDLPKGADGKPIYDDKELEKFGIITTYRKVNFIFNIRETKKDDDLNDYSLDDDWV